MASEKLCRNTKHNLKLIICFRHSLSLTNISAIKTAEGKQRLLSLLLAGLPQYGLSQFGLLYWGRLCMN